jgi:hypothetical protein
MKTLSALLLILFCLQVKAQKDTLVKGNTFIRFNAVNLADVSEPNISFGVERRFFDKVSLAFDAGYIFYSQQFHSMEVHRDLFLRTAARYFPFNKTLYLEGEVHYKQHTHHLHDWVGHDVVEGVPSYEEYKNSGYARQVGGLHLKVGRLIPVSKRIWLDMYAGIGYHLRKYFIVDDPDYVYNITFEFTSITTPQKDHLPAFPMGCRILYKLR